MKKGIKVEKEHTTSNKNAAEIARDHLSERPDYYKKLAKIEKGPIKEDNVTAEKRSKNPNKSSNRFIGTAELVQNYKERTPGQVVKEVYREYMEEAKSPAWQRKEGKRETGGLNQKGVESYRRENPGSKLKTAVTTEPSKLKKGSKSWKRRKSFCSRMQGMKNKLTSAKTARDPNSRINKSLRAWNCEEVQVTEDTYKDITTQLSQNGWKFARSGGSHDLYKHPESDQTIAVPRHKGDLSPGVVKQIRKKSTIKPTDKTN